MFAVILALTLTSQGTPARAIDRDLVIVLGRPGCTVQACTVTPLGRSCIASNPR